MEYYFMEEDKRVQEQITIEDFSLLFESDFVERVSKGSVETEAIFLKGSKKRIYTDFVALKGRNVILKPIYTGYFLISDRFKSIFVQYQEDLICKPCMLIDTSSEEMTLYWLCKPPVLDYKKEVEIKKVKIESEELDSCKIIMIQTKIQGYLMVSLEVVESMLRRNCIGVKFKQSGEVLSNE